MTDTTRLKGAGILWLRRSGYGYLIIGEADAGAGREDLIGYNYATATSCVIELKASPADYMRDRAKRLRHPSYDRAAGTRRYYLCPYGMIASEEIGDWGLLWVQPSGDIEEIKGSKRFEMSEGRLRGELRPLMAALRRYHLGQTRDRVEHVDDSSIQDGWQLEGALPRRKGT